MIRVVLFVALDAGKAAREVAVRAHVADHAQRRILHRKPREPIFAVWSELGRPRLFALGHVRFIAEPVVGDTRKAVVPIINVRAARDDWNAVVGERDTQVIRHVRRMLCNRTMT